MGEGEKKERKRRKSKKRKKERRDEIPSNPMFPLSIGASASVYRRSTNCRPQAIWTARADAAI